MRKRNARFLQVLGIVVGLVVGILVGKVAFSVLFDNDLELPAETAWQTVTDGPSGVAVELPGPADSRTISTSDGAGGTVNIRFYTVGLGDNDASVGLAVAELRSSALEMSDEQRLLGALQGAANNIKGTIARRQAATVEARPALDGEVTFTRDGVTGKALMRFVLADGALVQLQTIGKPSDAKTLNRVHERVVNSLKLG